MRTLDRYRRNVLKLLLELLEGTDKPRRGLDVGAGDGWFASELEKAGAVEKVLPVEIGLRRTWVRRPVLFDGALLPVADRSFDLVIAIDMLHHNADPMAGLAELLRCSSRYALLKDHTHGSVVGRWALRALDELGNRRFGVSSPGSYQRDWEWLQRAEELGFRVARLIHPAKAQNGLIGVATNQLQFVALLERRGEREAQEK